MTPQEGTDPYPLIETCLDFFEHYGGIIITGAFFLLMFYIFYWIIIIAPRRVRQVYTTLTRRGYSPLNPDSEEIENIVHALAPVYPRRPRKDAEVPQWKCHFAVKYHTVNQAARYIVHVSRSQIDQPGVRYNSTLRKTDLILEKRKLKFTEPVHIFPVKNRGDVLWEWRYKLKKVSQGPDQEFLDQFMIYTKSGKISFFPDPLREALMGVYEVITDRSHYCFQHGIHFKFQKDGWGICPTHEVYKVKDINMLIGVAETISLALS